MSPSLLRSRPFVYSLIFCFSCSFMTTTALQAEELRRTQPAEQQAPSIIDIALNSQGELVGQVLNAQGQPTDGAQVKLFVENRQLHATTTNSKGIFKVAGLKNGIFRIVSPGATAVCRVWNAQIAPPSARNGLVMIHGDAAARGQFGYVDPINGINFLLGTTAVVLGAITLNKIDDLESQNSKLNRKVDSLQATTDAILSKVSP